MKTWRFVVLIALFCAVDGGPERAALQAAADRDCAGLAALKLPDVKITDAAAVAAATTGAVRVAHCRVNGVIGTEIKFSLLLPDAWNNKFMMGGGGGFVGQVQNQANASINAGYATVGTDTGHSSPIMTDGSWALNNLERQVNFGYLAVHRTAEVAKAIIRSYYSADAAKSYFSGCSNGGRQAMMEAQRFPADFDGVVAGAPAYDFTGINAQFIKEQQMLYPDPRNLTTPMFPAETLKSIESQIVAKCDAIDGVKDGLIEDPRVCKIDVAALTGLTEPQRTALKTIYDETRNKDGVIYPAQPVGGEGDGGGWLAWIVGPDPRIMTAQRMPSLRFAFGTEFSKYLLFGDPAWDYSRFEFSDYRKKSAVAASFLNATDPNLDAFKGRGGKLILWHGWSDTALTALATIKYHEQVQAHDANMSQYIRTFLMPGVLHCAGGPGPDNVDWTTAIEDWVERGKAPDRLIAKKMSGTSVARTRPLCPYPQHAAYKGMGSIDEEASFVCK